MKTKTLLIAVSASVVSGCSQTGPTCSGQETINLGAQVAERELSKIPRLYGKEPDPSLTYTVDAARTTSTNKQTGAQECAAQLIVGGGKTQKNSALPITYTVGTTDNGEQIYVNVSGVNPLGNLNGLPIN